MHQSPLGWGTFADPPRSKAGLKHHSPTSGGSAPKEVTAGAGPMQISPQEKNAPGASIPTGVGHPCRPSPQEQSGAGASLPNIRGKCSPGGKLLCWGGAHADFSPGKKRTWCINPHGGGAPLHIPPQEQSGAGASLPNIRGKCPQGGQRRCWGGSHADFSPGKKRTWCINPHGGGTPLQIPPGAKRG